VKIMIRKGAAGLSVYVPKKDLEEPIVEREKEALWDGWVKLKNGWVLELPAMAADTRLPVTVEARKREPGEGGAPQTP
jgi:nitrogen fixation protein NifT